MDETIELLARGYTRTQIEALRKARDEVEAEQPEPKKTPRGRRSDS